MQAGKQPVKVAILDLYDGIANEGMRGFQGNIGPLQRSRTI